MPDTSKSFLPYKIPASCVSDPAVLLVSLSRRFGGADVRVMQLARAMQARGQRYAVATLSASPLYHKLREEGLNGVEVGRARADPMLLVRLFRLIRGNPFTVVDAHNPQSQFWGLIAAALAGVDVRISTVHSVYGKADAGPLHRTLYRSVLRLNRFLRCRFITISQEISEHLRTLAVPADSLRLITNGIENQSAVSTSRVRAELGWPEDSFVVGIFGRLTRIKGHRILFEALQCLREDSSVRCLVVGDGPLMSELSELVRHMRLNDIVHFAGFRSDVTPVMRACSVICQPSFSEGLPFTVLESAAVGRPLVISAVGALPDHFEHRRTACLIAPGNVDALVTELAWCRRNPSAASRMGEEARALVAERFGIENMLAETFRVYRAGCDS
jgi:glycosyltransferase involved in cell wall biosynthesis